MSDLARERGAGGPGQDPRRRLKRLRSRAEALQKDEALWALEGAMTPLFEAAELLIQAAPDSAEAAEALDRVFDSLAELLDGIEGKA